MKIICRGNTRDFLPQSLDRIIGNEQFSLIIGKEYLVYAVSVFYNCIFYYIYDEKNNDSKASPFFNPSSFFEISDARLSRYWILSNNKNGIEFTLSFSEWINDKYFYSNLADWGVEELKIFQKYKELMDLEFPDKSITEIAQIGDDKWLICPDCIDAWEYDDDRSAMVRCPLCKMIYHNPRYRPI